jgi:Uma2 family endonuclease
VLIVEISEGTLSYDRNDKGSLYAKAGILDYWIVNLAARKLEIYRQPVRDRNELYGHRYADVNIYGPGDAVAPLAAPKSPVKVADLLP